MPFKSISIKSLRQKYETISAKTHTTLTVFLVALSLSKGCLRISIPGNSSLSDCIAFILVNLIQTNTTPPPSWIRRGTRGVILGISVRIYLIGLPGSTVGLGT